MRKKPKEETRHYLAGLQYHNRMTAKYHGKQLKESLSRCVHCLVILFTVSCSKASTTVHEIVVITEGEVHFVILPFLELILL